MTVLEVGHGTAEYQKLVELRRAVLRLPIGLDFSPADLAAETNHHHFGAFDGGDWIGAFVATPQDPFIVKVRQVAVDPARQGAGIGRAMMIYAEGWALNQGYKQIVLNARDTAVPFYLGLDYELVGEPFIEVGIPHHSMRKLL